MSYSSIVIEKILQKGKTTFLQRDDLAYKGDIQLEIGTTQLGKGDRLQWKLPNVA